MALKLVTPSTTEVISLAEARDHVKCGTDEDDYLKQIIAAAVRHTELEAKVRLSPQVWKQTYHYFPNFFQLDLRPFRSLVAIKYYDAGGDLITFTDDDYRIDTESSKTLIYTRNSYAYWPDTQDDKLNAVEIHYEVGYTPNAVPEDEDPLALPEDLKQAVLLLIAHLYANREPVIVGAGIVTASVPMSYDWLVSPYREWLF